MHAVRGELTRKDVQEKLGWRVPAVFGDPALLLPEIFAGKKADTGTVGVIPHHSHRQAVVRQHPAEGVKYIDVKWDLRTVIEEISSSSAIVATALHGIILAQAYGVPWVWLKIEDKPMWGDEFKFEDFFSTLDRDAVVKVVASAAEAKELDFHQLARSAKLPQLKIDLSLLKEALPVSAVESPIDASLQVLT